MNSEQKFKDGDALHMSFEATNRTEMLIFTDKQQVYKTRLSDFDDTKASALGTYLPTKLSMDEGEKVLEVICPGNYRKICCCSLKTARSRALTLQATRRKQTAKSS